MKKMMAALVTAIFLASLLGCAAQMAENKAGGDEQTQKTLNKQADEKMWKRAMEP